jgi:hypothetical protein
MSRRFPMPLARRKNLRRYVVRDATGQVLVNIYARATESESSASPAMRLRTPFAHAAAASGPHRPKTASSRHILHPPAGFPTMMRRGLDVLVPPRALGSWTSAVMVEHQSALSVRQFAREDEADSILVTKLQQAVNLANQNCDRATALAHKLSGQLREAHDRINQLEFEANGFVDRRRAEAQTAIAKLQSGADARVDQTKREADERIADLEADAEDRVNRLQGELAQTKERADHAEQWLMLIRREIEGRFMSSFGAVHDRRTAPQID